MRPSSQLLPAQHGSVLPPQCVQADGLVALLARQRRLVLEHTEPVQHCFPSVPHATQVEVEFWQMAPLLQVPAAEGEASQQGCVGLPQGTQADCPPGVVAAWQVVFGAVQRELEQHGSFNPPQLPQAPAEQVALVIPLQFLPAATQVAVPSAVWATQQPSFAQKLPGQQGSPVQRASRFRAPHRGSLRLHADPPGARTSWPEPERRNACIPKFGQVQIVF